MTDALTNLEELYILDNDFEKYDEKLCEKKHMGNFDEYKAILLKKAQNLEEMWKPFVKEGIYFYNKQEYSVKKLVCMTKSELQDEEWQYNDIYQVEVSKYGRIRKGTSILDQFEINLNDGYLHVNISNIGYKPVYRLVAETFKPLKNYDGLEAHHINNNGHENTPQNLIWIPKVLHKQSHPEILN